MTSVSEAVAATTKSTIMKCHECNAPLTNDELGSCASGDESLTQGSHDSKGGNRDRWWWCRDCMATVCRYVRFVSFIFGLTAVPVDWLISNWHSVITFVCKLYSVRVGRTGSCSASDFLNYR
ncbi:unnamed protein product [Litomosoides sigmodontis]|uniref:Uncharacterized protein n=1 Tax=Litomosoides sigmodontis TaxID=42156 RepID=A0A3P6SVW7_LITSI|nr:unnamed protein product [Litomosoides sigmodontis]